MSLSLDKKILKIVKHFRKMAQRKDETFGTPFYNTGHYEIPCANYSDDNRTDEQLVRDLLES